MRGAGLACIRRGLAQRIRLARRPAVVLPAEQAARPDRLETAAMLCALGAAMLRAGEVTARVDRAIRDTAARRGLRARSLTLPGGLLVRVEGDALGSEAADFTVSLGTALRLDQVQALYALLRGLREEPLPPAEVVSELRRIERMPVRFRLRTVITGHVLMTVGLGLLLRHSTGAAIAAYAVLGLATGILLAIARRFAALAAVLPVLAAIIVSAAAVRWAGPLAGETPAQLFIPPLITFLPGAALTTGALELATGYSLAGIARVARGISDLLLLSLGILVGVTLAAPAAAASPSPPGPGLGSWGPWAGLLALGTGYVLYRSARPAILPWLLGALCAERLAEIAGSWIAGPALGAFAAGLILPLAAAVAEHLSDLAPEVIFLPSFWMLVPGAVGLAAVSAVFTTRSAGNLSAVITAIIAVLAVALGILTTARIMAPRAIKVQDPALE